MGDRGFATATERVLLAETLGLAMARRAAGILGRHRAALAAAAPGAAAPDPAALDQAAVDPAEFAADDAIFTAVLDAAGECLGHAGARLAGDPWCDALLQLLRLARLGGDED